MYAPYKKQVEALAHIEEHGGVLLAEDLLIVQGGKPGAKRYLVFKDYEAVKPVLTDLNNPFHLYEVFRKDNPCNLVVDLDIEDPEHRKDPSARLHEIEDMFCKHLKKYYRKELQVYHVSLKSPSTHKKDSFHITFRCFDKDVPVYFNDIVAIKPFIKSLTDTVGKEKLADVDLSIYTKNRAFRLLNSSKRQFPENKLVMVEECPDPLKTLGTYTPDIKTAKYFPQKKKEKPVVENVDDSVFRSDKHLVWELLTCLDIKFATNYLEWSNLGILLYCIFERDKEGLELWKRFQIQKNKEGYDALEMETRWESFGSLPTLNYKIGTLKFWANESNPERYAKVFDQDYKYFLNCNTYNVAHGFKRVFGKQFFKKTETGEWFKFDDRTGIWRKLPKSLAPLHKEIITFAGQIEKHRFDKGIDEDTTDAISSLCAKLKDINFRKKIIEELDWMLEVETIALDNNDSILPFDNGVMELGETCFFRKGKYEEYITMTTKYNYSLCDTTCAEALLRDYFTTDTEYNYMLMCMAKCLDAKHNKKEYFLWYNKKGSNGKSFLLELLNLILGSNFCCSVPIDLFLATNMRNNGSSANSALMSLKGKRLVYASEPPENQKFATDVFKRLTGNDRISARDLHKTQEEFTSKAEIVIAMNAKTPFDNQSDKPNALRLRAILFKIVFVDHTPTNPYEKVKKDIEKETLILPFVNLLIKYYPVFLKSYKVPDYVLQESQKYLEENNFVYKFCQDFIQEDADGILMKSDIKELWKDEDNKTEYDFKNVKWSTFVRDIQDHLSFTFQRSVRWKGNTYTDGIKGYSLKSPGETEVHDIDQNLWVVD